MKLVLYSEVKKVPNREMDMAVVNLIGKKDIKFGYVPSESDEKREHFRKIESYFKQYDINNYLFCDLDKEYNHKLLADLQKCDVVYLSGGNTYNFLKNIKKRKFDRILRNYAEKGGVIVGCSAGSYIMTPNIRFTSQLHNMNLKNKEMEALNLVDFEFIPHYENSSKQELTKKYIKQTKRVVYACSDGSGIIVNAKEILFFGKVLAFNLYSK